MYWDRWDIVDAHYWYCVNYHSGQWSREYQRLSRISQYYKPSILAKGPATENAQAIYDALCTPLGNPFGPLANPEPN